MMKLCMRQTFSYKICEWHIFISFISNQSIDPSLNAFIIYSTPQLKSRAAQDGYFNPQD